MIYETAPLPVTLSDLKAHFSYWKLFQMQYFRTYGIYKL